MLYAVLGWREGLVLSVFSMLGLGAGAWVAAHVGPRLVDLALGPAPSVPLRVAAVIAGLVGGAILGQALGHIIGRRVTPGADSRWRVLDSVLGALLVGAAATLVAWTVAGLLIVGSRPPLADALRSSVVLGAADSLVPASLADGVERSVTGLVTDALPQIIDLGAADADTPPPTRSPAGIAAGEAARTAIVEVSGETPDCGKVSVGSGWVFAPERVVTNAHVVAGMTDPTVQVAGEGRSYAARVVAFDAARDVAVLLVPDLPAPALQRGPAPDAGEPLIIAGFPGGGSYRVTPARLRSAVSVSTDDIYGQPSGQERQILSLATRVRQGNSGGPVLDLDGRVVGIVFGRALSDPDTGYALTVKEISALLASGQRATADVPVGRCITR